MMETLVQPYTPHLKKVLKKYQLSAVKSLQGPSNLLGPCIEVATAPKTETGQESATVAATVRSPTAEVENFLPPPFPVQQLPILTEADQRSERGETVLEGESISCFVVGGEQRLCLPQVLNSVLQNFSLAQINQVCDELQIYCSRCNPEQLEELKVTGILPASAPSCGLITKTDAERLCSALLHHGVPASHHQSPGSVSFEVYHECFGKCRGLCIPSLFSSPTSRCIECLECHAMFSPQHFVCHAHRPLQNRTCHWGFDSCNWRSYLLVGRKQAEYDAAVKLLTYFKEKDVTIHPNNKRKNHHSECQTKPTQGITLTVTATRERDRDSKPEVTAKKPKVEESSPPPPPPPPPPQLDVKPNEDSTRSHNGDKVEDVPPRLKALDINEPSTIRRINEEALRSLGIKSIDDAALRNIGIKGFDDRELKTMDDHYSYHQYAAELAAAPYIYWYDSWRTSAFRPWPSLTIKDSKSQSILRDSVPQTVPAYLSQGPPVLLHPERVVPLSESERFERTFQPNVALAPATHHRPKIECSETQVKCEPESMEVDTKKTVLLCPPPSTPEIKPVPGVVATARYNPEIELSTDTDDSSSETTGEHGSVPRGERVVEQVAEVLDALSDAKEATRARVVALVQQLASRLNIEEANVRRLEEENSELRHVQREQEDLIASKDRKIAQLQQRLKEAEASNKEAEAFQDKVVAMEKELRTSHSEMNGSLEIAGSGGGSPVSVITSSPNLVIKSEPAE